MALPAPKCISPKNRLTNTNSVLTCKDKVTEKELQEYIEIAGFDISLLLIHIESIGYELWYLTPDEDGYLVGKRILMERETDEENNDILVYKELEANDPLPLEEASELVSESIEHDLLTSKRIYESRKCEREDGQYATDKILKELDHRYSEILQEYRDEPNWYTAINVFMSVSLTAIVLGDGDIEEDWTSIHTDLLNSFSNGSSIDGDMDELDGFVDRVGDLLMLVRKRLRDAE